MAIYELDGVRPTLPESGNYWIADTAVVIGNTILHDDSSVWFNAAIRGDNEAIEIGARSNVQENCVLHVDPGFPMKIGANCTIGHKVMLHGCTIGQGSLVGMGAIVLNGAEIGEGSLVGAGALVPEGKTYPPRSLILGTPGKVVRELSDKDLAMIQRGVETYVRRWRQFKDGCVRIG